MTDLAGRSPRDAALEFLLQRIDYERALSIPYRRRQFRLDRMRALMERLGDPHRQLSIVHVAGTKGKGSTSAMVASMLTAAGYRTGLYSSPHLVDVEERLNIDGRACTAEELVALVDQVRPHVEALDREARQTGAAAPGPTYFEIVTALAMLHFAQRGVDAAVIEVGLGGRLDSTNVCLPRVSVITSISFDHMKQLGWTLASIAREKAGIIKPGVPVVSGVIDEEPRAVIDEVRRQQGSALIQAGRDFEFVYRPPRAVDHGAEWGEMDFSHRWPGRPYELSGLKLRLLGRHQAANAAVALAVVEQLRQQGWTLPEAAVRQGLGSAECPARLEVVGRRPTVILDVAHNAASVAALVETMLESFAATRRILVFGTTVDKPVEPMLRLLLPHFETVVLTRYQNNPRALPLETLAAAARAIHPGPYRLCQTPAEAWQIVGQLCTPPQLVCVTGSFFLAAEMRREIALAPLAGDIEHLAAAV
jgi:dihydrofolate synthase/folylpolyglutamate synthase